MAARQTREKSKRSAQPVAGTVAAEVLRALRRLVAYEGSIASAARVLRTIAPSLRLSRQRLSRWLSHGLPRTALEGDALSALLFALYTRFAQLDVDQPARDARDRKLAESRAAEEILRTFGSARARKRLVETLRGWCRRHGEVAKLRGLRQSGVQRFASELGVRADLLRAAIRPGEESLSVKLFLAFEKFQAREREQAEEDAIDRAKMDELMELARVPAQTIRRVQRWRRVREGGRVVRKKVWVNKVYEEPVLAKIPNGDWEFSGEGTHGWRWGQSIGRYLLPRIHPSGRDAWKVVEDFVRFALRVPGLSPAARYPEWNVYALASRLGERDVGSKQQYRELGHPDSRRFVVDEAYGGGSRKPPRARERTISSDELDGKSGARKKGFLQRMGEGIESMDVIFLHGGIAWNFRKRTIEEQQRREKARKENVDLQGVLEKVRTRQIVAKKKKAKRKQTLAAVMARRAERAKRSRRRP